MLVVVTASTTLDVKGLGRERGLVQRMVKGWKERRARVASAAAAFLLEWRETETPGAHGACQRKKKVLGKERTSDDFLQTIRGD